MTRIRKINQSQVEGENANQNDANEIRPLGEMAVYIDDDNNGGADKLELLMFDGVRTHLRSKVLAKGTFYGGDADSADSSSGVPFDTIKLIPDAVLHRNNGSYGNDQYIVIDPTFPNHIHVRAGGAIDASDANLILGGELTNVVVSDDAATVEINTFTGVGAGTNNWTFGQDGSLTLPQGGVISETAQEGASAGILLTPYADPGTNPDMAVKIYPTFVDDDHIHITAGNPSTVDLFLGDDAQYVKIEADGGNIVIGTNNDTHNWTFGTTGTLTLPASGVVLDTNGTPGLTRKTYTAVTGWFDNDSTWFETNATVASTTVITGTIQGLETAVPGYAEQLYGYFKAPSTATYTFGLHVDDAGMFWIGDDAVDGSFDDANANITYVWPNTVATYSVALTKDVYYPVRLQWGNNEGTAPNFGTLGAFWYSTDGGTTPQTDFTNTIYTEPGLTTVSKGGHEWQFGTDGALTLAKDIIVGNNGGHIYQDAGQAGNPSSIKWVNMTGQNNMLRVFADGITTMADERLNVGIDNDTGFYITTYSTTDSTWTFGIDGSTTLPGAVVNSTVAKTGIAYNTGTATALEDSTYIGSIVDGSYGPFTRGLVTFTVVVTSGVAAYTVTATTGNTAVGAVIGTLDTGDLGGTSGSTSNISVADVVQAATAIDLTKSVNKLTDGGYTLADGVEGQIMYLVAQNGVVPADVGVLVANSRNIGEATLFPFRVYDYSDDNYYDNIGGFCTLIFTDGAWQQTGGAWEIIT